MGKVVLDMAMSLNGFIAGPNDEDSGLHDYFFSPTGETAKVIEESIHATGALVMGRRTHDMGATQGGFVDSPHSVPTIVLSHDVPSQVAEGTDAFIFVTNGIESALARARAYPGDKDVVIGDSADTAQQFLRAGLIDELHVFLVPVLFGQGIRLFEQSALSPWDWKALG